MKALLSILLAFSLIALVGLIAITPAEAARSSYSTSYKTPGIRMPSYKLPSYSRPSYKSPSIRNYTDGGGLKLQSGYLKNNGTYVQPHFKTSPDDTKFNNRKYLLGY